MTTLTIPALEPAIQKTNAWMDELAQEFGGDYHHAYQGLRGALHALRDRLTVEEASDLAAQLPMIIRGLYYEGWDPSRTPTSERDLPSFLNKIAEGTGNSTAIDPERAARGVFRLLATHCTAGQVDHVRNSLPSEIQSLWPA